MAYPLGFTEPGDAMYASAMYGQPAGGGGYFGVAEAPGAVGGGSASCGGGLAAAPSAAAAAHLEIQREVDAMQVVYTREQKRLEADLRALDEEVLQLRNRLQASSGVSSAANAAGTCGAAVSARTRQVRWRLENGPHSSSAPARAAVSGAQAPAAASVGAEEALSAREPFTLEEFPGIGFTFVFCPRGSAPSASGAAPCGAPCCLNLEVSGSLPAGAALAAELTLEVERGDAPPLSAHKAGELEGAGRLRCEGPVLPDPSGGWTAVTCCAVLSTRTSEPPPLRFESAWLSRQAEGEERPWSDSDSAIDDVPAA
eukprot:TRINITY_DN23607_c0_g7_i1.p1 TRINITY_DN23607_c0_g7~~TRINITY_DN23607_c0_g7_i1.p1  ORF type:complete len:313 (-),score=74.86 TRINITY_DN23607_c0_g7_i1:126-1064(-)